MWPPDARELAAWWGKFDSLKRSYLKGFISRIEASDGLRNLRYRDDALRCELNDWEREREKLRKVEEHQRKMQQWKNELGQTSS